MDNLKTPLFKAQSDTELQLSMQSMRLPAKVQIKSFRLPPYKQDNSLNTDLDEKIQRFYQDDKEKKKFNTNTQTKTHKQFTCFDNIPALSPDNKYLITWKIFIMIITVIYFMELPVYIFFGQEIWSEVPLYAIDLLGVFSLTLFSIDLFLEFQTAYFRHGNPIVKKSKIAYNYLEGYFLFDTIAVLFVLDLKYVTFGIRIFMNSSQLRWTYFFFYFKLGSFLKEDETIQEIVLLHRKSRLGYQILRIMVALFICMNFYACIFYGIGTLSVQNGYASWLTKIGNFGNISTLPPHMRYFFSFYFSVSTLSSTMGYGDITPMNPFECSWAVVGMLFGIIIFVFNIQLIYDIAQDYFDTYRQMTRDKIAIHRFMRDKRITQTTKSRINQYLVQFWYEEGAREFSLEQKVLHWLGPELKEQLLFEAYSPFFQSVPMFNKFSPELVRELTLYVKEMRLSKGEKIIRDKIKYHKTGNDKAASHKVHQEEEDLELQQDNVSASQGSNWVDEECLYYIQSGNVAIHPNIEANRIELMKLNQGQSFGEYSFFTGCPRQSSVTTSSYAHLYFINRKDFLEILKSYPIDYEIFCMLRDQSLLNINVDLPQSIDSIQSTCFTCQQQGHVATSCHLTHYIPNFNEIDQVIYYYHSQQDTQVDQLRKKTKMRNKKKKWQTLRQSKLIQQSTTINQTIQEITEVHQVNQLNPIQLNQSQILITSQYNQEVAASEYFDLDQPKEFQSFFPKYNLSTVIQTYNNGLPTIIYQLSQKQEQTQNKNYRSPYK